MGQNIKSTNYKNSPLIQNKSEICAEMEISHSNEANYEDDPNMKISKILH